MLKKEGIINEDECIEAKSIKDEEGIVIGTVKFGNEDKGEPVYIKRKAYTENCNYANYNTQFFTETKRFFSFQVLENIQRKRNISVIFAIKNFWISISVNFIKNHI